MAATLRADLRVKTWTPEVGALRLGALVGLGVHGLISEVATARAVVDGYP